MTLRTAILLSFVCTAMFTSTCAAQSRGQTSRGATGGFGQGSSRQSGFGQGQSAFGGQGGRGQSRGGTGGAGFGANAFGAPGAGFGGQAAGGFGLGQQTLGNNQIGVGAGGDTFLGSDAAQTQNFFRNMNGGQRRAAAFDFMIENLNEMRDRGGRGNGRDRTPPVRVKLRPTFETPLGTMRQIDTDLQSRLTSGVTDLGVTDSRITMDGRTLTLEGKVATQHQRELAEKMMLLEPGVDSIDNRLTVEPDSEQ